MVGQFPRQERPLNKTAATTTTTPESFQTIGSAGNKNWKIFCNTLHFSSFRDNATKSVRFFSPEKQKLKIFDGRKIVQHENGERKSKSLFRLFLGPRTVFNVHGKHQS